jgi:hypothetical protein
VIGDAERLEVHAPRNLGLGQRRRILLGHRLRGELERRRHPRRLRRLVVASTRGQLCDAQGEGGGQHGNVRAHPGHPGQVTMI